MAKNHLMIAVNWYGPYSSIDEANKVAKEDFTKGLYMASGMCRYQRKPSLQYIGIAKTNISQRLDAQHHGKLGLITKRLNIWLGEIATSEPSGRKLKVTPATLDYAEWLHARLLKMPLNEKKTKTLPPIGVTVLNRWFGKDYKTPRQRRPHADWPDLLDFPHYDLPARIVFFGSRQHTYLAPKYGLDDDA